MALPLSYRGRRHPVYRSDSIRPIAESVESAGAVRVPTGDVNTKSATNPMTFPAALITQSVASVAHLTGADPVTVPAPLPMAVSAATPHRVGIVERRQIAHTIGVIVDFGMTDIATGDTDTKRNVCVGARHAGLRWCSAPRPATLRRRTNRGYRCKPSRVRVPMRPSSHAIPA